MQIRHPETCSRQRRGREQNTLFLRSDPIAKALTRLSTSSAQNNHRAKPMRNRDIPVVLLIIVASISTARAADKQAPGLYGIRVQQLRIQRLALQTACLQQQLTTARLAIRQADMAMFWAESPYARQIAYQRSIQARAAWRQAFRRVTGRLKNIETCQQKILMIERRIGRTRRSFESPSESPRLESPPSIIARN